LENRWRARPARFLDIVRESQGPYGKNCGARVQGKIRTGGRSRPSMCRRFGVRMEANLRVGWEKKVEVAAEEGGKRKRPSGHGSPRKPTRPGGKVGGEKPRAYRGRERKTQTVYGNEVKNPSGHLARPLEATRGYRGQSRRFGQ